MVGRNCCLGVMSASLFYSNVIYRATSSRSFWRPCLAVSNSSCAQARQLVNMRCWRHWVRRETKHCDTCHPMFLFNFLSFRLMSPYRSNTRCPSQILNSSILLAEGQSDDGACEATSSITAVAVEPTALLTVSREAYNSCLQAFHSEQSKQQLAFFESISIFRGVKKQVSGVFIKPHVPDDYL